MMFKHLNTVSIVIISFFESALLSFLLVTPCIWIKILLSKMHIIYVFQDIMKRWEKFLLKSLRTDTRITLVIHVKGNGNIRVLIRKHSAIIDREAIACWMEFTISFYVTEYSLMNWLTPIFFRVDYCLLPNLWYSVESQNLDYAIIFPVTSAAHFSCWPCWKSSIMWLLLFATLLCNCVAPDHEVWMTATVLSRYF